MSLDRFGHDIYAPPETTETRPRDGVYTGLARPWERDAGMLDAKGHLCSRACELHGDLKGWGMSDLRKYQVTVTSPLTLNVWALDEEDAKRVAFSNATKWKVDAVTVAVGFPTEITVKEITNDDN